MRIICALCNSTVDNGDGVNDVIYNVCIGCTYGVARTKSAPTNRATYKPIDTTQPIKPWLIGTGKAHTTTRPQPAPHCTV